MPRPKPPERLEPRYLRLSDRQWIIFNQLGGAEWLRDLLDKKDPFPKKYYEKLKTTNEGNHEQNNHV
jgi:hypothetical protein